MAYHQRRYMRSLEQHKWHDSCTLPGIRGATPRVRTRKDSSICCAGCWDWGFFRWICWPLRRWRPGWTADCFGQWSRTSFTSYVACSRWRPRDATISDPDNTRFSRQSKTITLHTWAIIRKVANLVFGKWNFFLSQTFLPVCFSYGYYIQFK